MNWNVDKPNFSELPADNDKALALKESEEESVCVKDNSKSTPSFNAQWCEAFPQAGWGLRRKITMFESLHYTQIARGESIWVMFSDKGD